MRLPSILMVLLGLAISPLAHGHPYSTHTGKWMWDNSDIVCAVRMTKWTARESSPGEMVLVIEYSDLKSFKGAEQLPQSGAFILNIPDFIADQRLPKGFSREFSDNEVTLLFLKNESGILQPPTDGEGQFSPAFQDDGPISRFQSFKELLLYAAGAQPDNCYAFFDLMTGFEDQELRDWLVAKTRSADSRTASFALDTLATEKDPETNKLAKAVLERCKDTISPESRKLLEHLIEKTEDFATPPPL